MRYRRMHMAGQWYFFTVVTAGRRPVFADPAIVGLLRTVVGEVRRRHPFTVEAAVILPDHLHMIWRMPEDDGDFSTRWRLIKRSFAMRCGLGRGVWQGRFWEHRIRDDEDYNRHVAYIHWNPVKHGLVARAEDWPWSSIHRFPGATFPDPADIEIPGRSD